MLLEELVASGWPAEAILAVWKQLLNSASMEQAVDALAKLAAEAGQEHASSKSGGGSRQHLLTELAAALLDQSQGQARESLVQASGLTWKDRLPNVHALNRHYSSYGCHPNTAELAAGNQPQALTSTNASGTVVCLLTRVQLQRGGNASAAWHLLSACLPAACQTEPNTVEAVLKCMFKQEAYQEVRQLSALSGLLGL